MTEKSSVHASLRLRSILSFSQHHCEQRHSHIQPILHLTEVCGTGIIIEVDADLADARERMHHDHILLGGFHDGGVDHVRALDLFIIGGVFEAFLLDAGDIQHIGFGQDFIERADTPPAECPSLPTSSITSFGIFKISGET